MRYEPLLRDELVTTALSFGLGVGLALGFAVRSEPLLLELLTVVAFSELFGVGDGFAFSGSFALMLTTASNSRPHSIGTIKRIPRIFIRPA